jgi:hypothetical protein
MFQHSRLWRNLHRCLRSHMSPLLRKSRHSHTIMSIRNCYRILMVGLHRIRILHPISRRHTPQHNHTLHWIRTRCHSPMAGLRRIRIPHLLRSRHKLQHSQSRHKHRSNRSKAHLHTRWDTLVRTVPLLPRV